MAVWRCASMCVFVSRCCVPSSARPLALHLSLTGSLRCSHAPPLHLCSLNHVLGAQGVSAPRVKKTGTTIVGVIYKVRAECNMRALHEQRCSTQRSCFASSLRAHPAPCMSVKDGVVLGADTRATEGETVCDKNCEKIHYIADNIWCCGAGTSADTEATTQLISSQIELHRLATGKAPRTITALTMLKRKLFQYQGHISAALVLGGFDCNGPSLYTVR
eukprot:scaffold113596_cov41-Tisochrysis_lutea.AAC.2